MVSSPDGNHRAGAQPRLDLCSAMEHREIMRTSESHPSDHNAKGRPAGGVRVAVVGMACRLPRANSPDAAWDLVVSGRHAIAVAPEERWRTRQRIAQQKNAKVQTVPKLGGYLDDIDAFDAAFFGVSAREARLMDPQQRLLMQTTWQAIEDSGVDPNDFKGSRTGVFVGISTSDYLQRQLLDSELIHIDAYSGLGTAQSIAANRISHFFDFHGPSIAVDTACSSASVAVHLARQSLLNGECDHAVVGGVNVIVSPLSTISFSKARMLAPDGMCKSFDSKADGYVRSEGCVVIVLSREDVLRDHDQRVRAWVAGSAINQDGRTLSITTPNGAMQTEVIRDALASAELAPGDIDFVETHGTGTTVGDRIELDALAAVFSGDPLPNGPVTIGAIKPHFGHLEAASGLLGLLKAIKSFEERMVPKLSFLETPIGVSCGDAIQLAEKTIRFDKDRGPLRAGVSCFGFGGTNAHIILEEAAPAQSGTPGRDDASPDQARTQRALPVSSHSAETFARTASDYRDLVSKNAALNLDGLCHAAAQRRSGFPFRTAVVFEGREDLIEKLDALAGAASRDAAALDGETAFCFSGQGAQFPGMCAELYARVPVFRDVLETCDRLSQELGGLSLLDAIFDDSPGASERLAKTNVSQPTLFSIGLALAKSWEAMGITPDYLIGHSLGEITAACFAGVMGIPTAMRLVLTRARLMASVPGRGAMMSVSGPTEVLEGFIAEICAAHESITVSGWNTPTSATLSGPSADIDAAEKEAAASGLKSVRLAVSAAFHSAQMDTIRDTFLAETKGFAFSAPRIPIISTVTGEFVDCAAPMDATYWARQIREAVDFRGAVGALNGTNTRRVVEIGPRPVLGSWLHALKDKNRPYAIVPALRAHQDTEAGFLNGLAEAYEKGAPVDWTRLAPSPATRKWVSLPPYRFESTRYWFTSQTEANRPTEAPAGNAQPDAAVLRFSFDGDGVADLIGQHVVRGRAVVPGALYVDLMVRAAQLLSVNTAVELRDCDLHELIPLSEATGASLAVRTMKLSDGVWDLVVGFERPGFEEAKIVAKARVASNSSAPETPLPSAAALQNTQAVELENFYASLEQNGLLYGPAFRPLAHIASCAGTAEAQVDAPNIAPLSLSALNPCQLDGGFQVAAAALQSLGGDDVAGVWVPTGLDRLVSHRPLPQRARVVVSLVDGPSFPDQKSFDIAFYDQGGAICLAIRDFRVQRIGSATSASPSAGPLFELAEVPLAEPRDGGTNTSDWREGWAIHAMTPGNLGAELAGHLNHPVEFEFGAQADLDTQSPSALIVVDLAQQQGDPFFLAQAVVQRLQDILRSSGDGLSRIVVLCRQIATPDDGAEIASDAIRAVTRVLRNEIPKLRATNLLLASEAASDLEKAVRAAALLPGESDLVWRDGTLNTLRLRPIAAPERHWSPADRSSKEQTLQPGPRGGISKLALVPLAQPEIGEDDVLIAPEAAGLNFRDVLKGLKQYPNRPGQKLWMGDECAGRVVALGRNVSGLKVGDPVMAVAPRAFSTLVSAPRKATIPIPEGLSFEEAATIPIAFSTAWYGLVDLAGLSAGDTVLIHAAAGGVGLAALQIARDRGARVIATAGSKEKRAYLGGLGVETIGNTRDLSFVDVVLEATGGQGVDVVLNSLAGPALQASVGLLRPFGRFVDIGKRDIVENRGLNMRPFHRSVSFHALDMELLFGLAPDKGRKILQDVINAFEADRLSPLPRIVFPLSEAPDAFQYMSGAKNIGKIVLSIPQHRRDRHAPALTKAEQAPTAIRSALITGAFGKVGLELVRDLANSGIKGFVLVGRSGRGPGAAPVLDALEARGIKILSCAADASDRTAMEDVFSKAEAAGFSIRHVIHAAGLLEDGMIADLDSNSLARSWAPKVEGARILDALTRERDVESFVCLSSVAPLLGSPGQAAYAMANAGLDALCRARARTGLPATSVNFGPWRAGMAEASTSTAGRFDRLGLRGFSIADGVQTLRQAMAGTQPNVVAARFSARLPGQPAPPLASVPICRDLYPAEASTGNSAQVHGSAVLALLAETDADARKGSFEQYLIDKLASVLSVSPDQIDASKPMADSGFDSLVGLEFGMMVEEETGAQFPMDAIDDETTLSDLAALLLSAIPIDPTPAEPRSGTAPPEQPAQKDCSSAAPDAVFAINQMAAFVPDAWTELPNPSVADYIKYVRPDFARLLPVLNFDRDYTHARGNILTSQVEGKEVQTLDFVGGFGSCLLGHNHPRVREAAMATLAAERPVHTQGAARGFSGTLARRLAETLGRETGDDYAVAFANSGSEAIESALKHAILEYAYRAKLVGIDIAEPGSAEGFEPVFLAIEGSYHGKTLGALSIGHFKHWARPPFGLTVRSIPRNDPEAARAILAELRREKTGRSFSLAAGLFVEPVQGEGGVRPLDPAFLHALRALADENGFPLIFDEIQSGFFRCGTFAASTGSRVAGDYYTFGKSLGGGIAKISALLIQKGRYRDGFGILNSSTFAEDDFSACAALAALRVVETDDIGARVMHSGALLQGRLEALKAEFPDVIKEVRGAGLMFGVELSGDMEFPSGILNSAARQELLGPIVSSYLLARHNIRVASPLSAANTLRLQPSAYVTGAQIDKLITGLRAALLGLRNRDGAYLISHLLDKADWLNESTDCGNHPSPLALEPSGGDLPKVGFLIHITDDTDLLRWDPSWSRLSKAARQDLNARFAPLNAADTIQIARITTEAGEDVEMHFKSIFASTQTIEGAMRQGSSHWIVAQIQQAVDMFADKGFLAVGLGGFLSIVTQNGRRIDDSRIGVTTGNALTVAAGIRGLKREIRDHIGEASAKIGIVGANGNIGQSYAQGIANGCSHLTLIGRSGSRSRLKKLVSTFNQEQAAGDERFSIADTLDALRDCNVIITATNSPEPIIYPGHLGSGPTVILDISVPSDVSDEVREMGPRVRIVPGSLANLPNRNSVHSDQFGLPSNKVFACMAETALLGLEGLAMSYSRGDVTLEQVDRIAALADKHGFEFG